MKKIIRNSQGFTLVELMVVVAIIGILATVAIPNFKKYQAKAKASEAKLALASVYSAETAFVGEWDVYAACLDSMGITAPVRGYYIYGFAADNTTMNASAVTNGATCGNGENLVNPTTTLITVGGGAAVAAANITGTSVAANTFVAGAAGKISADTPATTYDVWRITQAKLVTNAVIGY